MLAAGAGGAESGQERAPFRLPPRSLILFLGTLGVVFHLPYRQLEGLARGLKKLIGIPAPDDSTLSLRLPKLNLDPNYEPKEGEPIGMAVDATGIKVTNRGEWMRSGGGRGDEASREPGGER